jgi:hypothetical protein
LAAKPDLSRLNVVGPVSVKLGETAEWGAAVIDPPKDADDTSARSDGLDFVWDIGDGRFYFGTQLKHAFHEVGFQRIGLNVSDGERTELAWKDVYVVKDVDEIGTEGDIANWTIEDFQDRNRSEQQISRASFTQVESDHLVGKSALHVVIKPYMGFRVALRYPTQNDARWTMKGKSKLVFWLKSINEDVTGWQGGPFIALSGAGNQRRWIEPKDGSDLMRQLDHNEARDGWRLMQIPLQGNDQWRVDGELPETVRSLSLNFDSWGSPPLQFWIDGLAFE